MLNIDLTKFLIILDVSGYGKYVGIQAVKAKFLSSIQGSQ